MALAKLTVDNSWPCIPDSKLIGLSGIFLDVPSSADPRLQGEGKLRQIDEPLPSSIWSVVSQRLAHQVDLVEQACFLQPLLHLLHGLQSHEWVEVAVDTNYNLMKTQLVIITIMQCHLLDMSTRFLLAVEKILFPAAQWFAWSHSPPTLLDLYALILPVTEAVISVTLKR